MCSNRHPIGRVLTVHPLRAVQRVCTSFLSRAAYSASIPSASGAREKTIWDSRQRASSSWCCFSAQSHGVSRFSFSTNKSASLCTSNWGETGGKSGFEQWNTCYIHQYGGKWLLGTEQLNISLSHSPEMLSRVLQVYGPSGVAGASSLCRLVRGKNIEKKMRGQR